jgi:hypothetical protein
LIKKETLTSQEIETLLHLDTEEQGKEKEPAKSPAG